VRPSDGSGRHGGAASSMSVRPKMFFNAMPSVNSEQEPLTLCPLQVILELGLPYIGTVAGGYSGWGSSGAPVLVCLLVAKVLQEFFKTRKEIEDRLYRDLT